MDLLWEHGLVFVREMLPYNEEPRPHFNTVSAFVRILEGKGFVAHETFGISHRYYATITREGFRHGTLKGVISKYFNNSYLGAVSSLIQEEDISIEELKDLIRQVKEGKSSI